MNGDPIDPLIHETLDSEKRTRAARALADRLAEAEKESVPPALVDRAKKLFEDRQKSPTCPHCGKAVTPFKTPLKAQRLRNAVWAALAVVSFAGSFAVPRYFYQFLAAFLFFGFRWVMDSRATRTQILVYKALKEEEGRLTPGSGRDLHHPSAHL